MKTINNDNWYGTINISIDDSLFEHGILVSKDNKKIIIGVSSNNDNKEYYEFILIDYDTNNIKSILNDKHYVKNSMFDAMNSSKPKWDKLSLADKLDCLSNYWGWDNIFGEGHDILNKQKILNFINNYKLKKNENETIYTAYTE